mgnify:CR=1 FL=1
MHNRPGRSGPEGIKVIVVFLCIIVTAIPAMAGEAAAGATEPAETPEETADAAPKDKEPPPQPEQPEGPLYPVSGFTLSYAKDQHGQVPLDKLDGTVLNLGQTPEGLAAPAPERDPVEWTLGRPRGEVQQLYPGAIRAVCSQLVEALNRHGLLGVYVVVDGDDIAPGSGKDQREGKTTLALVVWTTTVHEVRTVAAGNRIEQKDRINSEAHTRVREHSPFQAGDVLRRREVNNYVHRLNRHPGRSVDMAVSAAGPPGEAVLDYMVAENKPWTVYFQAANTGTEETSEWRERFGFTHTQLTGADDILSLDYVTTGFDEVHALVGSYQHPLKWLYSNIRVYGSWNEYTASEVGQAEEEFEGEGWMAGAEVVWNLFQSGPLFVDVLGGARWEYTRVENTVFEIEGEEDFFIPYVGLEVKRNTRTANTGLHLDLEKNLSGIANTDEDEVVKLGRLQTEEDWTVFHWNVYQSFFLEPIIFGKGFKNTENHRNSTLAHEISLEFSGQHALGDRLIPQAQKVVGGTYTVRGYPESVAVGDDVYVARGEYRFHVPRALKPNPTPPELPLFGRPFRLAPQHVYGRPDWDLVLKAFVDWGRTENNHILQVEEDEDLLGVGVGVELQVLRNVHVRLEYGRALREIEDEGVEQGDGEIHFGLTLIY